MQEWPCPLQWQCCPDSIGCAERKFDKATSPSASWCRGRPKNHDLYINVAADMCFTYRQFDYMYLYIYIYITIYKSISLFSGLIALDSGVGGVAGRWVVHVLINPAVALDGMGDRCH